MTDDNLPELTPYVGDRLRDALQQTGRTQIEVEQKIGFARGGLSPIVTGKQTPSLETVEKLAKELGYPPAYFFPNYTLSDSEPVTKSMAQSIVDDVMELTLNYLKPLKLITKAMRDDVKRKSR